MRCTHSQKWALYFILPHPVALLIRYPETSAHYLTRESCNMPKFLHACTIGYDKTFETQFDTLQTEGASCGDPYKWSSCNFGLWCPSISLLHSRNTNPWLLCLALPPSLLRCPSPPACSDSANWCDVVGTYGELSALGGSRWVWGNLIITQSSP